MRVIPQLFSVFIFEKRSTMIKRWQGAIFFSLALLGVLLGRVFYESKRNYDLGQNFLQKNKFMEAVLALDQSAHWYFPGNPYVEKSLSALWELGQKLEATDIQTALWAYDSARGSIYASQSFFLPHQGWLTKFNDRIAFLRAHDHVKLYPNLSLEEAIDYQTKILKISHAPHLFWSMVLVFSFIGWITCTFLLIGRGFTASGEMILKSARPWIFGMIGFFTLWILSLTRA